VANVIRKRTLAGLKAARARGRVGGRPEKLSVRDKQQIRAAAEGLVLETFLVERVGEFYEEATGGRSASHHLPGQSCAARFIELRVTDKRKDAFSQ